MPDPPPDVVGPEGEPFVVRPGRPKRLLLAVVAMLLPLVVVGLAFIALIDGQAARVLVVLSLGLMALALVIATPIVALMRLPPVLALGPAGLWVASSRALRPTQPHVWVAWQDVERVVVQRRLLHHEVQVLARPPDRRLLVVALWGVDRSPAQVRAALAQWAADVVDPR